MTRLYERAGLSPAEMESLSGLVGAVWSADPTVPWVAVRRSDAIGVVAVVARLVDGIIAGTEAKP